MEKNIIHSDGERFERDVLRSDLPVIVDFYSEDCPPCEALAPVLERLAARMEGRARFVKILRQANRALAGRLGVSSSPTLLFFHGGRETGRRLNGFIDRGELRAALEDLTGASLKPDVLPRIQADLIVLGAGPAGMTAALYAGRAKLKTVLLEQGLPGGQAATTFEVANYPGTDGAMRGRDLTSSMLAQAVAYGAQVHDLLEIYGVDVTGTDKTVETDTAVFHAPAIVVATGAEPRMLPVEEEPAFRGRGVHYCATCDGSMYEDRDLIVLGGGNSAVEEAIYLTRFAKSVTIVHEFDCFQASKVAQERAAANAKIKVVWESHIKRLLGGDFLRGVVVRNLRTGRESELPADGVFVYIGLTPRTGFLQGQIELDGHGYVVTNDDMSASIPGVFAAGDVRVKSVRQVVTAAADGAVAAVAAERYLDALQSEAQASA